MKTVLYITLPSTMCLMTVQFIGNDQALIVHCGGQRSVPASLAEPGQKQTCVKGLGALKYFITFLRTVNWYLRWAVNGKAS